MTGITVRPVSIDDPDIQDMIDRHYEYTRTHTPPGSGHAVKPRATRTDELRYWLATDEGGSVVGSIGLRAIGPTHAEVKTMHVLAHRRGKGIGGRLLRAVEEAARREGRDRLSLETGRSDGFAASRAFYGREGFEPCAAFGGYAADPFSYCMSKRIAQDIER